jgi:hypothetical protein
LSFPGIIICKNTKVSIWTSCNNISILLNCNWPNCCWALQGLWNSIVIPNFYWFIISTWIVSTKIWTFDSENKWRMSSWKTINLFQLWCPKFQTFVIWTTYESNLWYSWNFSNNITMNSLFSFNLLAISPWPTI